LGLFGRFLSSRRHLRRQIQANRPPLPLLRADTTLRPPVSSHPSPVSRLLGTTATAFNADLGSLVSAIRLAQNNLNRSPIKQITILSPNPSAIQAITNLRPHTGQFHSREFCSTLTQILSVFRNAKVNLDWCPSRPKSVGIKRCIELVLNNAANPLPPNLREPHTVAFQKATAKEFALAAWQARWHSADRRSRVYLAPPPRSSPRQSKAQ